MHKNILIVEDERAIREMLALYLHKQGYQIFEAEDYQTAIAQLPHHPQMILLDWMLPGRSGIHLISYLKKQKAYQQIPIVMLTARSAEEDCITCLNAGADDYIIKPFSPKVLAARLEAVYRRVYSTSKIINIDDLILDPDSQRVSFQQQEINLSATEYKLLCFFMAHPEKVYSREQLLNAIWPDNIEVEERTVDSYIRRLRGVLQPYGFAKYIQTIRGFGYRFSNHFND